MYYLFYFGLIEAQLKRTASDGVSDKDWVLERYPRLLFLLYHIAMLIKCYNLIYSSNLMNLTITSTYS